MGLFRSTKEKQAGFDCAALELATGEIRRMTRAEFKALPLGERVRAILGKKLKFFLGDREVPMKEALSDDD